MKSDNQYKKRNTTGGKFGANSSGMSIHKFAKGKSIDMKRIKREKEIERFKKHKALSKYAKLCKAEGIVSDRVHIGPKDSNNDTKETTKETGNKNKTSYNKALQMAELKEKEKQQIITDKKTKEDAIKQAEKARKEKTKLHMKRTKTGQPILHNQVHAILQKLQSEKVSSN